MSDRHKSAAGFGGAVVANNKNNNSIGFSQNGVSKPEITYKVAKSSKKLNKIPSPRPALEIYRPPVLRRNHHTTKSSEDLSTKPLVAGLKQPNNLSNSFYEFRRTPNENCSPRNNNNTFHTKTPSAASNFVPKNRYKNGGSVGNLRTPSRRSVTPPPQSINNNNNPPSISTQEKMKRSNSFVKDLPKKKPFMNKEAQEVKFLLNSLDLANDESVRKWIGGNFESQEVAGPVGEILIQAAIERTKPMKVVGKLCFLLMDCPSGEQFHKGLVKSCSRYYECRTKLRNEHFRYWLSFINMVSELYANFGFTYEGELVQILLQLYEHLLQSSVLENIKIEELECLISSLLNVGYNLERQCPDKLSDLLMKLRDAFIMSFEPWVRKMILLLIELSASGWKLPAEANDYYFQTHSNTAAG